MTEIDPPLMGQFVRLPPDGTPAPLKVSKNTVTRHVDRRWNTNKDISIACHLSVSCLAMTDIVSGNVQLQDSPSLEQFPALTSMMVMMMIVMMTSTTYLRLRSYVYKLGDA